jgi:hypothetical protein
VIYEEFINQIVLLNKKITPMYHIKFGWVRTKCFFVAKMADLFQHNVDMSLKANNSLNPYYFLNINKSENYKFTIFLDNRYQEFLRDISKYNSKIEQYKIEKDEIIPKKLANEGFKMKNEKGEIIELVWFKLKEKLNIDIFLRSCPPVRHILEHLGNTKTIWDILVTFIEETNFKKLTEELLIISKNIFSLNLSNYEFWDIDDFTYFFILGPEILQDYLELEIYDIMFLYSRFIFMVKLPIQTKNTMKLLKEIYLEFKIKFFKAFYNSKYLNYFINKVLYYFY